MSDQLAFINHICPACGGRCCGRVPADGDEFNCHDQYGVGCKYRGHEIEWTKGMSEGRRVALALSTLADFLRAENVRMRPWEDDCQRADLLDHAAELLTKIH